MERSLIILSGTVWMKSSIQWHIWCLINWGSEGGSMRDITVINYNILFYYLYTIQLIILRVRRSTHRPSPPSPNHQIRHWQNLRSQSYHCYVIREFQGNERFLFFVYITGIRSTRTRLFILIDNCCRFPPRRLKRNWSRDLLQN